MLKTPSGKDKERLLQALAHLQESPDWRIVRAWLEAEQDRLVDALVTENDETARGAIRTVRVLLKEADTARDQANKIDAMRTMSTPIGINRP